MNKKKAWRTSILGLVLILLAAIGYFTYYFWTLSERISQHETLVLGQSTFVPGSLASIRVLTRAASAGSPLADAQISLSWQASQHDDPVTAFSGMTDANGTANILFEVPDAAAADQTLIIETNSSLGADRIAQPVQIERRYKILLTTDKSVYQPGQTVRLRGLVLDAFDQTPAAGETITIKINDGRGNQVFRQSLQLSTWGGASLDFPLAAEVNSGTYQITAELFGPQNTVLGGATQSILVADGSIPKINLQIETIRSYYLAGDRVAGVVRATDVYGNPLTNSPVTLAGFLPDVDQTRLVSLQGLTDAVGNFSFAFDLPQDLGLNRPDAGVGHLDLQAVVTSTGSDSHTASLAVPISTTPLVIAAIPEAGYVQPGVENIFYVQTRYPDGAPAATTLAVRFLSSDETQTVETGDFGIAEVLYTPQTGEQDLTIRAQDKNGLMTQKDFHFEGANFQDSMLIRPDKPVYFVGETLNLTFLSSSERGTIYCDIQREGQTLRTASVALQDSVAQLALDLSPDLYGTLAIHAYQLTSAGITTPATRLVIVDRVDDINLLIEPQFPAERSTSGQTPYFVPGETAQIDVRVQTGRGQGQAAALGLAVVPESIDASGLPAPNFAKRYFLLTQTVGQPQFSVHGLSTPDLVGGVPVSNQAFVDAIEASAQASLAVAALENRQVFSLQANSHDDVIRSVSERQQAFFKSLSLGVLIVLAGAGGASFFVSIWIVVQESVFRGAMLSVVLIFGLVFAVVWVWPQPASAGWLAKMIWLADWFAGQLPRILTGLLGTAGLGLALFMAFAAHQKDRRLGWQIGLVAVFMGLFVFWLFTRTQLYFEPDLWVIRTGGGALFSLILGFLFQFGGYLARRQTLAVFAILALIVSLSAGALTGLGLISQGIAAEIHPQSIPAGTEVAALQPEAATVESAPPVMGVSFADPVLWLPEATTDADGFLRVTYPVTDSAANWRLSALALTPDGRLASASIPLRVSQDFALTLELPQALTLGDEIQVPVTVRNHLDAPQIIRVAVEPADGFILLDSAERHIEVAAKDVRVVYFPIRATQFGVSQFKVSAFGAAMSDVVQRELRIYPDGSEIWLTYADQIKADSTTQIQLPVEIPADVIPQTQRIDVRIYPGILSQLVDGGVRMAQLPTGSFEQTASGMYPNVLVLDYLSLTDHLAPELQLQAETALNLGYQRLTTFEVERSGGFSLFGSAPPDPLLTAYGLQILSDLNRVYPVDPALTARMAAWLLSQQNSDGSWNHDPARLPKTHWASLPDARLPVSAYIVWGLADAGYGQDAGVQAGLAYLQASALDIQDAYVLGLVANALVSVDINAGAEIRPATLEILDRLANLAILDGPVAAWQSDLATWMGSTGAVGSIETSALATLAFLRANRYPDLAGAALRGVIQQKEHLGTWHSTQATVLTLKALLQSVRAGSQKTEATVRVRLNGDQTQTVEITPENADVMHLVSFEAVNPGAENVVSVHVEGEGALMYQVDGHFYLPWAVVSNYPQLTGGSELMDINLRYDRAETEVNDTVGVLVGVSLKAGQAASTLIALGLPPGFAVETQDFEAILARYADVPPDDAFPIIERFEVTDRQILVYVCNLTSENALEFAYRLRAKFPLVVQTPASRVSDNYNPGVQGKSEPQLLIVNP